MTQSVPLHNDHEITSYGDTFVEAMRALMATLEGFQAEARPCNPVVPHATRGIPDNVETHAMETHAMYSWRGNDGRWCVRVRIHVQDGAT